jgi:hypothetical protein
MDEEITSLVRFPVVATLVMLAALDLAMISAQRPLLIVTILGLLFTTFPVSLGWFLIILTRGKSFLYTRAVKGDGKRFLLSVAFFLLIILPYGVDLFPLIMTLLVFLLILGISGAWFVFGDFLDLLSVQNQTWSSRQAPKPPVTAMVCKECFCMQPPLVHVGLDECWNCRARLKEDAVYSLVWRHLDEPIATLHDS